MRIRVHAVRQVLEYCHEVRIRHPAVFPFAARRLPPSVQLIQEALAVELSFSLVLAGSVRWAFSSQLLANKGKG